MINLINNAETKVIPYFNLAVPTELEGVDTGILDPRDTYANPEEWDNKAKNEASGYLEITDAMAAGYMKLSKMTGVNINIEE